MLAHPRLMGEGGRSSRLRSVLKWGGTVVGVLVVVLVASVLTLSCMADRRMEAVYDVDPEPIVIPDDPESIERGERLYAIWNCRECHGADAAGRTEDVPPGQMHIANLTLIANEWSSQDWVRAVRHGVAPSGRPLRIMPANEYNHMSDEDLGDIIAYVRSLPQRGAPRGSPELNAFGKVFVALDLMPIAPLPAEEIDHDAPRPPAPEPGPTVEYGRYLSVPCAHCHGETMAGGEKRFFPMPIANITMHESGIGSWTREDFVTLMRTGRRPDGRRVDQENMNTERTSRFTDDELDALWAYLQSLPPRPWGEQSQP